MAPEAHPIKNVKTVALCGQGLALWMSAAALSHHIPRNRTILCIETGSDPLEDYLYGSILPPSAYKFHLSLGLLEPDLLLNSSASFVYGTQFQDWASTGHSWVQAFHQPFPIWDGVPLVKLIHNNPSWSLQATLISALAALKGGFAHPPEDTTHPLSRAEYGYAVSSQELAQIYKTYALRNGVQLYRSHIADVQRDGDNIKAIHLSSREILSADLFVNCGGVQSDLDVLGTVDHQITRTVRMQVDHEAKPLGGPLQIVQSTQTGWLSQTSTRAGMTHLTVSEASETATASRAISRNSVTIPIFTKNKAWAGNVVSIGHAASTLEPLTTAPMKILIADVERLISLFPLSTAMHIETREYNQQFVDDVHHATLFHLAHFDGVSLPRGAYWDGVQKEAQADIKLARKRIQYESRGHLIAYDNEPFVEEDWAILRDGLGRRPDRPDMLASVADTDQVSREYETLTQSIQTVLRRLPPHPLYLQKFLSYLQRKQGSHG